MQARFIFILFFFLFFSCTDKQTSAVQAGWFFNSSQDLNFTHLCSQEANQKQFSVQSFGEFTGDNGKVLGLVYVGHSVLDNGLVVGVQFDKMALQSITPLTEFSLQLELRGTKSYSSNVISNITPNQSQAISLRTLSDGTFKYQAYATNSQIKEELRIPLSKLDEGDSAVNYQMVLIIDVKGNKGNLIGPRVSYQTLKANYNLQVPTYNQTNTQQVATTTTGESPYSSCDQALTNKRAEF